MTDSREAPPAQSPSAPTKADPEGFALRAEPARAIRFRREVVVTIAALASVGVVATAWYSLKPTDRQPAGQVAALGVAPKAPTDALGALPTHYGDAPKLGPPLPGDLGRPILAHQRAMATETGVGADAVQEARRAAAAERVRRQAELKAARESGLMARSTTPVLDPTPTAPAVATPFGPVEPPRSGTNAGGDPNSQQRKIDFVGANDQPGGTSTHRLTPPAPPYTLSAGSVIAASLITGLRSDLPGLVTAQVTERVYDSATGSVLLIPQGARLIGTYDSVVAFGQRRALVVWQRIILPDGSSMTIDNVPATDPAGYAGLADKVDFHTWTLLKGVALSTLLGVGSNLTLEGESDLVQAIRESTQQNVSRAGDQLTSRNLQIQPTISIRPGAPVRLVLHRDLNLARWKE